jgi:hypothetical protein
MDWRTAFKAPANRMFPHGLENRYPSLGGSRVQIPPPPLDQAENRITWRFSALRRAQRRRFANRSRPLETAWGWPSRARNWTALALKC